MDADADYTWACERPIASAGPTTAEQWARAVFEDAPPVLRAFFVVGWKVGLGLRLAPDRTPGTILGWRVLHADPHRITLAARSRIVQAENSVQVDDATITWRTSVRYNNTLGRAVWSLARPLHQLILPRLLARADHRRTVG